MLLIGGLAAPVGGQVLAGLIGLVLAVLAGRYEYRIWTWQARRLLGLSGAQDWCLTSHDPAQRSKRQRYEALGQ